jgi:pimeloyl-ACP methyl ester carboxylesterase
MFEGVRAVVGEIEVPGWIEPERGESLASYGARMAGGLAAGETPVLGGVSMGGMLALEMARHIRVRGLVLISTATDVSSVSRLRWLERLSRALPGAALIRLASSRVSVRQMAGRLDEATRRVYVTMVRETAPSLLRWGMRAVLSWPGADAEAVPVLRVHGDEDRLFPVPVGAEVVRGAGHLCVMTHAERVGELVQAWAPESPAGA